LILSALSFSIGMPLEIFETFSMPLLPFRGLPSPDQDLAIELLTETLIPTPGEKPLSTVFSQTESPSTEIACFGGTGEKRRI
jgi:hypothetical protein